LEKDPQKRLRHIGDVMALVEDASVTPVPVSALVSSEPRRRLRTALVATAACVLVAAVTAFATWFLKPAPPKPVSRFAMSLPPGQRVYAAWPQFAISPDGAKLVYSAGPSTVLRQLYLRAMDGLEAHAILGTEAAYGPFFSPDGEWIGFFGVGGKLRKVLLSGGQPVDLADVDPEGSFGASWGSQGRIAFVPRLGGPVEEVSDAAGNVQPLTRLQKTDVNHVYPEWLPNGAGLFFNTGAVNVNVNGATGVAVNAVGGPIKLVVSVQSLKTGQRRDLAPAGVLARYAPSGHIVFMQGSA
jgi:serine/threonine-protein kinase